MPLVGLDCKRNTYAAPPRSAWPIEDQSLLTLRSRAIASKRAEATSAYTTDIHSTAAGVQDGCSDRWTVSFALFQFFFHFFFLFVDITQLIFSWSRKTSCLAAAIVVLLANHGLELAVLGVEQAEVPCGGPPDWMGATMVVFRRCPVSVDVVTAPRAATQLNWRQARSALRSVSEIWLRKLPSLPVSLRASIHRCATVARCQCNSQVNDL